MNELEIKIQEIASEIQEIESTVKSLLNYGNVPTQNWTKACDLLNQRAKYREAQSHLKEVHENIQNNNNH